VDPYNILGVDRNSTQEEIKSAYRKLASKHHPDHGGSTSEFQKIQEAYSILGDPDRRRNFDSPPQQHSGFPPGFNPFNDFINQVFNQQRQRIYTLTVFITLEQVATGAVENVQVNTGSGARLLRLGIPRGVDDGGQIRYQGILDGGDLLVQYRIHKHQIFNRVGNDLYATSRVNVLELIAGTKIIIKDIFGSEIELIVPPMTKPGTKFRIPGRGLVEGADQYVLIDGVLPDTISAEAMMAIKTEIERNKK
jgi:curved DNA-binding protein